ncbi:hypothetical protein M419DRAFT_119384 [Trichoderma reesei RUT C-30]|uniref:Uncharacterized protein n=1 Tax=Hypocrea jecorina (strain ATCC 56765 / BCRC 32924 / NRRL 11460 / Rut C-30) TaxID=1344414 RepID=A0A024S819_HYPJR|nr:hypothetical protein M419DRAFT_119384 [Trichoderma reesei RUT C-30]
MLPSERRRWTDNNQTPPEWCAMTAYGELVCMIDDGIYCIYSLHWRGKLFHTQA